MCANFIRLPVGSGDGRGGFVSMPGYYSAAWRSNYVPITLCCPP